MCFVPYTYNLVRRYSIYKLRYGFIDNITNWVGYVLLMIKKNEMTSNQRVVVVTGTSSGIGQEISLTLARNGFLTYATMRNLNKKENIKSVAEKENLPVKIMMLDVTDDRSVNNTIQSITDETSRIDVLVNNAGYGLMGAFEDLLMDEIKALRQIYLA